MQLSEERADINDERNSSDANKCLMKQVAARCGCGHSPNDPKGMKPQVERSLQRTAHHDVLHETDQEHTQERAEKPAGMTEIIYAQIHDFSSKSVRQSEGREQVKQDGL